MHFFKFASQSWWFHTYAYNVTVCHWQFRKKRYYNRHINITNKLRFVHTTYSVNNPHVSCSRSSVMFHWQFQVTSATRQRLSQREQRQVSADLNFSARTPSVQRTFTVTWKEVNRPIFNNCLSSLQHKRNLMETKFSLNERDCACTLLAYCVFVVRN